jgi:hypothetical protein
MSGYPVLPHRCTRFARPWCWVLIVDGVHAWQIDEGSNTRAEETGSEVEFFDATGGDPDT